MRAFAIVAVAFATVGWAQAQVTVDGQATEYGDPLTVQTVGTQFGNNGDASPVTADGSELNAGFALIDGGKLNMVLSGNLQTNFNKLEVFVDAKAGGQNQLRSDNPDIDFNGLNRMAELTFDASFAPDYFVTYTTGVGGSGNPEHFLNAAELATAGAGAGGFVGGGEISGLPVISGAGPKAGGTIEAALDNSNVVGVGPFGDPFDSDPATVLTGVELTIDLNELGWDGVSLIKIAAFVNGSGHDFVSNQVLGGLPAGTGNLGEPANVDFNQFDGLQYFVIPEPASLMLLALGGLMLRRR